MTSPAVLPRPGTQRLFGLDVDALTMEETVEKVRHLVRDGGLHRHVVLNAAKVVDLARTPALRQAVDGCDLINADGMSVVWASRVLSAPLPQRVTGIELFERLVGAAAEDGDPVYFLGARPEVVEKVVEVMTARHPNLRVAGYADGYWTDDESVITAIAEARPVYLFLAIPSPRKEYWLAEHHHRLGIPFVMGVGGSFDVVAGLVTRAPRWIQQAGFEWAWRLLQEPRRMWRRYVFGNAAFIRLTMAELRRAHS